MYWVPINFGALCKSTYNLTTRPHLNGLGRQNIRLYVHRGAAAKMFHFLFYCNYMLLPYFLFLSFPFFPFSFSFFSFFLFSIFCRPPQSAARGESPLCPPLGTPLPGARQIAEGPSDCWGLRLLEAPQVDRAPQIVGALQIAESPSDCWGALGLLGPLRLLGAPQIDAAPQIVGDPSDC